MTNQQSQTDLKTRSVVSCFIFSLEKADSQVALFRRSAKVRTYQWVFWQIHFAHSITLESFSVGKLT